MLRQLLEHILGGRRLAGGSLAGHGDAELAEEDFLQLLGRVEIKGPAGLEVRLLLKLRHPQAQLLALDLQQLPVHEYAVALHREQHRHERLLDRLVQGLQARQGLDLRPQRAMQAQRDIRILSGIFRRLVHVDLVERQLLRALAGDILEVDRPNS